MGIASIPNAAYPVRKLDINGIPEAARLIMLVGPTGSGKSTILRGISLFFAAQPTNTQRGRGPSPSHKPLIKLHGNHTIVRGQTPGHSESNVSTLISQMINDAAKTAVHSRQTATEIFTERLDPFAELFNRIFPSITIRPSWNLGTEPEKTLVVTHRGKTYPWRGLSSGEMKIFCLLMSLMYDAGRHPNRVYVLDEPETNVHSHLQEVLLEETLKLIPDKCQLWIATQSIGMIHKAVSIYREDPSAVSFLELDSDFEGQTSISPVVPDRDFNRRVLKVAISTVADLVVAPHVVLCEGRPLGTGSPSKAEFDAKVLRAVFSQSRPSVDFYSAGSCTQNENDILKLAATFMAAAPGIRVTQVIDRDHKSSAEIEQYRAKGMKVLSRYSLESYLWCDEILEKLLRTNSLDAEIPRIIALKRGQATPEAFTEPIKDKAAIVRSELVKLQQFSGKGSTADAFAKSELTPLLTPDTQAYQDLDRDIFG